jgi:hypothetical protein
LKNISKPSIKISGERIIIKEIYAAAAVIKNSVDEGERGKTHRFLPMKYPKMHIKMKNSRKPTMIIRCV